MNRRIYVSQGSVHLFVFLFELLTLSTIFLLSLVTNTVLQHVYLFVFIFHIAITHSTEYLQNDIFRLLYDTDWMRTN